MERRDEERSESRLYRAFLSEHVRRKEVSAVQNQNLLLTSHNYWDNTHCHPGNSNRHPPTVHTVSQKVTCSYSHVRIKSDIQ